MTSWNDYYSTDMQNMFGAMQDEALAQQWFRASNIASPDGQLVETKIDDAGGVRNVQPLMRRGGLWWLKDGSMYVYYTPTHWRPLAEKTP